MVHLIDSQNDIYKGTEGVASYLASYSNVDMKKIVERVVTSDEQITDLFHVV